MLQSASFFVAISVRSANAQPSRNWMIKRDWERLPTSKKHFVRQSALLARKLYRIRYNIDKYRNDKVTDSGDEHK